MAAAQLGPDRPAAVPPTWSGRVRGRPGLSRRTRIPAMTCTNRVESPACPAVSSSARGRPLPSRAAWILLVGPPRVRPSASAARAVCGVCLLTGPSPCDPSGAGGVLVGPHDRRVDRHLPYDRPNRVVPDLDVVEELLPGAVPRPAAQAGRWTVCRGRTARAGPTQGTPGPLPDQDPAQDLPGSDRRPPRGGFVGSSGSIRTYAASVISWRPTMDQGSLPGPP